MPKVRLLLMALIALTACSPPDPIELPKDDRDRIAFCGTAEVMQMVVDNGGTEFTQSEHLRSIQPTLVLATEGERGEDKQDPAGRVDDQTALIGSLGGVRRLPEIIPSCRQEFAYFGPYSEANLPNDPDERIAGCEMVLGIVGSELQESRSPDMRIFGQ